MAFLLIAGTLLALFALLAVRGLQSITFSNSISGYANSSLNVTVSDSHPQTANPTILAAQPATLTTRSSGTAGTLTMTNTSHGIVDGQRIDLYWTGGQAYAAIVGTVSGTSVPFTSASGTALPIATTAISVGICKSTPLPFTGDNLTAVVYVAQQSGWFVMSDGASDLNPQYVAAGQPYSWYTGNGVDNPLAGDTPTVIWMSHGYQTAAVTGNNAYTLSH